MRFPRLFICFNKILFLGHEKVLTEPVFFLVEGEGLWEYKMCHALMMAFRAQSLICVSRHGAKTYVCRLPSVSEGARFQDPPRTLSAHSQRIWGYGLGGGGSCGIVGKKSCLSGPMQFSPVSLKGQLHITIKLCELYGADPQIASQNAGLLHLPELWNLRASRKLRDQQGRWLPAFRETLGCQRHCFQRLCK